MNKKPVLLRTLLAIITMVIFGAAMYPLAERDYYEVFQELLKDSNDKEALDLLDEAALLAAGYDYDTAIAKLEGFTGNKAKYPEMEIRLSEYKQQKSLLVAHNDPGAIPNLSFHLLIADPARAKSILDTASAGQVFAETYACVPSEPMMVSVVASEKTEVLFLNIGRILQVCTNNCSHHNKIIHNLLSVSARKNLNLSRRIFHTSAKSIRGRLLSYLSYQAMKNGSREFDIPFSRQQLADYLSVDRSALSNELSKMQKDGLLKVSRNHFTLLETIEDEI